MTKHQIKQKLISGETLIGTFINCADPTFIEISGLAGFDFAIIDLEHSPLSTLAAQDLCRSADSVQLAPIIRTRKNDPPQIQRALDIGSAGIQVPQIETKAEAETVIKSSKYAPLGSRGLSLYTRAGLYTSAGSDIITETNNNTLIIVHVESQKGVDNIAEIATLDHLDIIFLGPYDLSQSLGIPGQINHPQVIELMTHTIQTIRNAGKIAGTFCDNPETAKKWINAGVQYIALGVDVGIYFKACQKIVNTIRN